MFLLVATAHLSSADSNSDDSNSDDSSISTRRPRKIVKKKIQFYTPRLLAALDKCKVSGRDAIHLLSAAVIALGYSIDDVILGKTSLAEYRKEHRKEIAEEKKKTYHVNK